MSKRDKIWLLVQGLFLLPVWLPVPERPLERSLLGPQVSHFTWTMGREAVLTRRISGSSWLWNQAHIIHGQGIPRASGFRGLQDRWVSSKGHVGQAEFSPGCKVMVFSATKLPGEQKAGCVRREKLWHIGIVSRNQSTENQSRLSGHRFQRWERKVPPQFTIQSSSTLSSSLPFPHKASYNFRAGVRLERLWSINSPHST